jgi:hypothetical protein
MTRIMKGISAMACDNSQVLASTAPLLLMFLLYHADTEA